MYVDFIIRVFITNKRELHDLLVCASQIKHEPLRNDASQGHLLQKLVTLHARRRQSCGSDVNKLLSGGHRKTHILELRWFVHAVMKLTHVYVNVTGAEEEEASVLGICVCVCVCRWVTELSLNAIGQEVKWRFNEVSISHVVTLSPCWHCSTVGKDHSGGRRFLGFPFLYLFCRETAGWGDAINAEFKSTINLRSSESSRIIISYSSILGKSMNNVAVHIIIIRP